MWRGSPAFRPDRELAGVWRASLPFPGKPQAFEEQLGAVTFLTSEQILPEDSVPRVSPGVSAALGKLQVSRRGALLEELQA